MLVEFSQNQIEANLEKKVKQSCKKKKEAQEAKLMTLDNFAVILCYYALTPLSLALTVTLSFSDGTAGSMA